MERYLKRDAEARNLESVSSSDTESESSDVESDTEYDSEPRNSKRKRVYSQKTRIAWLKDKRFKSWIAVDDQTVTCKLCNCKLRPKLCGLIEHASTKKHIAAESSFSMGTQSKIPFKKEKITNAVKAAEISNALYIASHTSIRSVDHLSAQQKNVFWDSEIGSGIKLGRTKCSCLIKNVLSPHFKASLLSDIGQNKFSLIIDESTDIAVIKYLGIVVRYFSISTKSIVNSFLKLAELEEATAQGIVNTLLKTLSEFDLDVKNLIGLGTDNASVMVGVNKGVITLLKEKTPNIVLIPCTCHSIQLAVSAASKSIPTEIEFLVAETYNWFSRSSTRQKSYAKLYALLNDGLDPLKTVRACDTRWLSIETAVTRIHNQWLELKTQFGIAATAEHCHKAKMLVELYNEINLAYIIFLKPILHDVHKVNKLFESNNVDPMKIFNELNFLLSYLCSLVVQGADNFDPLCSPLLPYLATCPQFCHSFEMFLKKQIDEHVIDEEAEKKIRENCSNFIITLIEQLRQRLPINIDTLKKIDFFSVENALKVIKPKVFGQLHQEKHKFNVDKITSIETQWQRLTLHTWSNLDSTVNFWAEVHGYRNALGENPFSDLCNLVFSFLVLPISNADVERIFSSMNIIKTKQRNRMGAKMLNAILDVRYGLKREKKCCHTYNIGEDLVKRMDSTDVYGNELSDEDDYILDINL